MIVRTYRDGVLVDEQTVDPPETDETLPAEITQALADLRGRQTAAFEEALSGGNLSMARLRDAMLAALTVD